MKQHICGAATLAFLGWATFSGAEPVDALWERAVALAGANSAWKPGRTHTRTEMLKGDGTVKGVEEIWTTLSEEEGGELTEELVEARMNGKDITPKKRKEHTRLREQARKEKEKAGREADRESDDNPFLPSVQADVSAHRMQRTKDIDGRPCRGYEVAQRMNGGETMKGIAWLDEETGAPLELTLSPDPLPKFVKRMSMTFRYVYTAPDRWFPVELRIEGAGGVLFTKKAFRSVVTLSEHWQQQAAN